MPQWRAQILLVPICLSLLVAPAHGLFFGSSGPTALEKTQPLASELKERTGTIWNQINLHVDQLLKTHNAIQGLTPEAVNALTEGDMIKALEERQQWEKKFSELRNFLSEEYGLFVEKVKGSDIEQSFKEAVIKHYDETFREAARKDMYPFLNGMENINQSLLETYKVISVLRFPLKSSNTPPETINQERLNIIKSAVTEETIEKVKTHGHNFAAFLEGFHFNPIEDNIMYQAALTYFAYDEKLQLKLKETFIETFLDDGAFKAEANMKFYISTTLNNELPGLLSKASGEPLVKYAQEDVKTMKKLALGGKGNNTKSCLLFADAKEFVGVDYSKVANDFFMQDALWDIDFFKVAYGVVASAKTAPQDFSAGRKQAEPLLELGKKSAIAAVKKDRIFIRFMKKNKFSPRRFCFQRYALLQELLKLPSPAREDTLRLIYLEDLERRVKNMETAAGKK